MQDKQDKCNKLLSKIDVSWAGKEEPEIIKKFENNFKNEYNKYKESVRLQDNDNINNTVEMTSNSSEINDNDKNSNSNKMEVLLNEQKSSKSDLSSTSFSFSFNATEVNYYVKI